MVRRTCLREGAPGSELKLVQAGKVPNKAVQP